MKKMKLKMLRLNNFMNVATDEYNLDSDVVFVTGENGEGKTTIATAYTWLTTNCDLELNNNPDVRRKVNGQPVNDADVVVEAVIEVDGIDTSFRKVQRRKRTETEKIVDGHIEKVRNVSDDNSYFVNEVPKTMKAFNEYFGNVKLFQMCSSMTAFISKKENDMREYLFSKITDISDLSIAQKNEELTELIPLLEKYKADEIEAMNKTAIARTKKELPVIDGRIKEKEEDIQNVTDIVDLERKRKEVIERLEELNIKILVYSKEKSDTKDIYSTINSLKHEQNQLYLKANEKLMRESTDISEKLSDIKEDFNKSCRYLDDLQDSKKRIELKIADATKEKDKAGMNWKAVKAEKFDDKKLECPTCHRELPEEECEKIKADFEKNKKNRLESIEKIGFALKDKIESLNKELSEVKDLIDQKNNEIMKIKSEIEKTEKELNGLPLEIYVENTDEYKNLSLEIAELERKINEQRDNSVNEEEVQRQIKELQNELSVIDIEIGKADKTADEERLKALRKERLEMEQNIVSAEKVLFQLNQLSKKKNEMLEDSINSHFKIVKFKLFEFNKNGGYKNTCIPTIDEKSIMSIESNKGNRIIGQLDILNSIQEMEDFRVPIFVDDAESLDSSNLKRIINPETQMIILKVSDERLNISLH